MRLTLYIITILLIIGFTSHAQERDTYQVDSVMKNNNIKTKIRYYDNTVSKARQIYHYDKQGKLIKYELTDNYEDNKIQFNVSYIYNDSNKIIREVDSSFSTINPSVEVTEYSYENNGNFSAIQYNIKKKKKIISEIKYLADSSIEKHFQFDFKGKIYRENISYYERPNYTLKFAGNINNYNSPESWEYIFINVYDLFGKIIERTRTVDGIFADKSVYFYDSAGLLIRKTRITYYNGIESRISEVFDYTKWN